MARGIGEKLDDLLDRQAREYLDQPKKEGEDKKPEIEACRYCCGEGFLDERQNIECPKCNGTGKKPE